MRQITWIFMTVGTVVGGYIPLLWGDDAFSFTSVILGGVGGILGIYIAFKLNQ